MSNQINLSKIVIIILLIFLNFVISQDKGLDYYNNQEFKAARDYYTSILQKSSSNSEAQLGRGSSSFQIGDFNTAKDAFEKSLESGDNSIKSKALYNLGNIFYKNEKSQDALAFYRKALELNPNDKEAIYNYELLKYAPDPPEEDQKNEDKNKDQQQEQQQQEQQQQEQQQQEQQQQEQQQEQVQEASDEEKSQDMKQAESILDALKQDEQIMQKKQIARSKSRKLDKDW